jgi:hypothetical protein
VSVSSIVSFDATSQMQLVIGSDFLCLQILSFFFDKTTGEFFGEIMFFLNNMNSIYGATFLEKFAIFRVSKK